MTFARTGRICNIRTAPTRELDFRGSSLSKSINFVIVFRFRFRSVSELHPEPPFGAIYIDFVFKMTISRSPRGSVGFPKECPRGQYPFQKVFPELLLSIPVGDWRRRGSPKHPRPHVYRFVLDLGSIFGRPGANLYRFRLSFTTPEAS